MLSLCLMGMITSCRAEKPEPNFANTQKDFASASEINKRLGRGINLGNTYEGDKSWGRDFNTEDFGIIAGLGFTHVRIPIRWERDDRSEATAPYKIFPEFLSSIQKVVNAALRHKLHVIINMHHQDLLMKDPAAQKERFIAQWRQIAEFFKSAPDSVVFEVLNEPHENLTPELWNDYFPSALNVVRATNPRRCVLIGTANWGGVGSVGKLRIPVDDQLILTIHYYNPFHFTHQGASWVQGSDAWLGTKWLDTQGERKTVENDFAEVIRVAQEKKIPVHIGEFGAYSKADMDSRIRWTRFLARWFEQQGFSWAYWEFNAGFGIYDPSAKQLRQGLVNALTRDEMPPPAL